MFLVGCGCLLISFLAVHPLSETLELFLEDRREVRHSLLVTVSNGPLHGELPEGRLGVERHDEHL